MVADVLEEPVASIYPQDVYQACQIRLTKLKDAFL
jgi:hypothetical protein